MKTADKGKRVQQKVALRKLDTSIRAEEDKLKLKQMRYEKTTNTLKIAKLEREMSFLKERLNALKKERKQLLESMRK